MDRDHKRHALHIRLLIAGIAAAIISYLIFHPIEVLMEQAVSVTFGAAWMALKFKRFWLFAGASYGMLLALGTAIVIYLGHASLRDTCRSAARSTRFVWRWNLRPSTQRFAMAALAMTLLFMAAPHFENWTIQQGMHAYARIGQR